ncbi:hypothetical protein Y032_0317g2326 [Ancylostoma ceylanicum]|uniref:Uncharacterized protein n=1 Tax=Ancylostoma ceylanicum TaxID=53326 RepID=A0A016S1A0_9BILA|nr:hypothetical protein Y032_0317g2326 [Ancylostoma ceylanicum]
MVGRLVSNNVRLEVEVCKTKRENGIQTLELLPMSLRHYPLGHPSCIAVSEGGVYQCGRKSSTWNFKLVLTI